jgi:hypothetical protein
MISTRDSTMNIRPAATDIGTKTMIVGTNGVHLTEMTVVLAAEMTMVTESTAAPIGIRIEIHRMDATEAVIPQEIAPETLALVALQWQHDRPHPHRLSPHLQSTMHVQHLPLLLLTSSL